MIMKKIKFMVIAAILSLACVLGFVACNNDTQTFPTEPMTITLNKTTLDIERHEEFTLTATVNNGSGTVYWSVDGTAVVCSDGVVRGVSEGTATVKATCGEASATCAVTVTDTGKGIPKSNFKRIFEPGFTTKTRGWGLGLSLSRRIIESYHKGRIGVVESEIGKGTTIRITLKKSYD